MQGSREVPDTTAVKHHVALQDRSRMYSWGSVFYAIYFWVSFPVFLMMDEKPRQIWTVSDAARDALASGMAVTILLDLWRIAFTGSETFTLPWLMQQVSHL